MPIEFKMIDPPERKRTYYFANGSTVVVQNVMGLRVSDSGTHRLETTDGRKVIVNNNWLAIELDIDAWSF